jgi:hypothetical protein
VVVVLVLVVLVLLLVVVLVLVVDEDVLVVRLLSRNISPKSQGSVVVVLVLKLVVVVLVLKLVVVVLVLVEVVVVLVLVLVLVVVVVVVLVDVAIKLSPYQYSTLTSLFSQGELNIDPPSTYRLRIILPSRLRIISPKWSEASPNRNLSFSRHYSLERAWFNLDYGSTVLVKYTFSHTNYIRNGDLIASYLKVAITASYHLPAFK